MRKKKACSNYPICVKRPLTLVTMKLKDQTTGNSYQLAALCPGCALHIVTELHKDQSK